ncbi:MAG TPA: inner membrane-spanning protein YciB [Steroidobacteraceae bacterium]|nr:inner membrane-spanning protein YciB [Steroidobacteraceae bacterium]
MNALLEWLPLLIFFIGFKAFGIYAATAALMVALVALLIAHRMRTGKFKPMHAVTAATALVLGTATLALHDERFIQWKPTVLLAMAAGAFLASFFFGSRPLARRLLEGAFAEELRVAPRTWRLINGLWAIWFALLAAANLYVAHHYPDAVWVNFKVFGISIATLVFVFPQVLWLASRARPAPDPG